MLSMLMKACGIESVIIFPDSEVIAPVEADESSGAKNGTNLNVASIMLEWAKSRELLNELVVHEDKCGKRYVRFTTALTSSVLPEAQEASSGWRTRTHYFYEIVNEQGKKIYIQFALSGENLPDDLKVICERINEKFPSRVQKTDWKWRCPFVSERVMLTEKMSKEDIVNILNKLYAQTKRLYAVSLQYKLAGFSPRFSVNSLIIRSLRLPLEIISLKVLFLASGDILENLELTFL